MFHVNVLLWPNFFRIELIIAWQSKQWYTLEVNDELPIVVFSIFDSGNFHSIESFIQNVPYLLRKQFVILTFTHLFLQHEIRWIIGIIVSKIFGEIFQQQFVADSTWVFSLEMINLIVNNRSPFYLFKACKFLPLLEPLLVNQISL